MNFFAILVLGYGLVVVGFHQGYIQGVFQVELAISRRLV